MVNATTSDGNSSDTTIQGGEMERKYKYDGSTTRMNRLEINKKMDYVIFKDHTSRSTTNYEYKYYGNTLLVEKYVLTDDYKYLYSQYYIL